MELLVNNKKEMTNLACQVASLAKVGDAIGLVGDLGVGKSFFAAAFINSLLDIDYVVPSPTFNLVYSYLAKKGEIFHFDLYRIKDENELENIGFEDAIKNGICLIEWPRIAKNYLVKNYLEITFQFTKNKSARLLSLKSDNQFWLDRLKRLKVSAGDV